MSASDIWAGLIQGGNRALEAYMNASDKKKEREQQLGLLKAEKGLVPKTDEQGNVIPNEFVESPEHKKSQALNEAIKAKREAIGRGIVLNYNENGDITYGGMDPQKLKDEKELLKTKMENDPYAMSLKQIQYEKAKKESQDSERGTGDERKAAGFADRLAEAEGVFNSLVEKGYKRADDRFADFKSSAGKYFPSLKSSDLGQQEQAERNFVNALLRRESGAAISKDEFKNAEEQYFPRPGDTQEVLDQKKLNRQTAFANLKNESGRAYGFLQKSKGLLQENDVPQKKAIQPSADDVEAMNWLKQNPKDAQSREFEKRGSISGGFLKPAEGMIQKGLIKPEEKKAAVPKQGDVVDGYIFKGGDPSKPENWEVSKKAGL